MSNNLFNVSKAFLLATTLILISMIPVVSAQIEFGTQHLEGDNELVAIIPNANISFVPEARMANNGLSGDNEMNIHTPPYTAQDEANYKWYNNSVEKFNLTYNAITSNATFTVTNTTTGNNETVTYNVPSEDSLTDLLIRGRAAANSSIHIYDITLDGEPVGDTVLATGTEESDLDILWLKNIEPSIGNGFTLKGNFTMTWYDVMPTGSNMAFQIKVGTTVPGSMGDYVWEDLNENGIQDEGEPGVGNIEVHLYDYEGKLIATNNTDSTGYYIFEELIPTNNIDTSSKYYYPGNYTVKFMLPDNYYFTSANQGSDYTVDSDANVTTGFSETVTLQANEKNLTVDAGIYKETKPMVPPHHNVKINIPTANPLFVVGILGLATTLFVRRKEKQ